MRWLVDRLAKSRANGVALLLSLTFFLGGGQALAFDLLGAIDRAYNQACNTTPVKLAINALNLGNFCRVYAVFKRALGTKVDIGRLLGNFAEHALRGVIDGALFGTASGIRSAFGPELDAINKFLGNLADGIERALDLPYRILSGTYSTAYWGTYSLFMSAWSGALTDLRNSSYIGSTLGDSYVDSLYSLQTTSLSSSDSLVQDFGYGTESPATKGIDSVGKEVRETLERLADEAEEARLETITQLTAETVAKAAEEEAREATQAAMLKRQEEIGQKVAEMAAGVTLPALVSTTVDAGGQQVQITIMGTAEKYRQEAQNAPSDRALLELQVKALADIMEQLAIYFPAVVDILTEQTRLQVFTTEELRREAMKAKEEAAVSPPDPDLLLREVKDRAEEMRTLGEDFSQFLKDLCRFYGGDPEACSSRR